MEPNPGLIKAFTAGGTIAANTIVKLNANDGEVVAATAKTDLVVGIARDAGVAGDRVDVTLTGSELLKAAGAIAAGDYVVATAAGEAVAGTATTAKQQAIGIALETVANNDLFTCLIARSQFDLA